MNQSFRLYAFVLTLAASVMSLQGCATQGTPPPIISLDEPVQAQPLPELPKPAEMERIATPWRPFCSVASWYLWRSLDGIAAL